jgi:hypothetical protein
MNVEFQIPRRPKRIGRFCLIGALRRSVGRSKNGKKGRELDLEEVNVHFMCPGEEFIDDSHSVVKSKRKDANSRAHRVSAPNPIPKSEDIVRVDSYQRNQKRKTRSKGYRMQWPLGQQN